MTTMRSPHSLMPTSSRQQRIGRVLFAAVTLAMSCAVQADEHVEAVFKARDLNFFYRSSSAPFPCYELGRRVANILRAVGARDDIKVDVNGCEELLSHRHDPFERRDRFDRRDPFDNPTDRFRNPRESREQSAHVRVQLMSPVVVTPAVLAEIERDKSRRELVSRVTGNPTVGMNDPVVFPAHRQEVTLSRRSIRLEPEDCELLEQLSTSVFRDLDVRVVRRNFNCDSRQPSLIAPQLTVEALLPSPVAIRQPVIAPSEALPSESAPIAPSPQSQEAPLETPSQ